MAVILRYLSHFGSHYVKMVEDRSILFAKEMWLKYPVSAIYDLWWHSYRLPRKSALKRGDPHSKWKFHENCVITWQRCKITSMSILCNIRNWHTQHSAAFSAATAELLLISVEEFIFVHARKKARPHTLDIEQLMKWTNKIININLGANDNVLCWAPNLYCAHANSSILNIFGCSILLSKFHIW